MLIVAVCLLMTLVFALGGSLVWMAARVLRGRGAGWKVFTGTFLSLVLFLPVFIFFISPLAASYFLSTAGTRPQERNLADTPDLYGQDFVSVDFSSRDGVMLRGWLMEGEETKPTIILCHGLFRSRQEGLERGSVLNQNGFSVLLFDFRNHGRSDGKTVSLGFLERFDVLGAYDFLKQTKGKQRFVLLGISMGAVAAFHAAGDFQQDLEAVIADSPFRSLNATISHHTESMIGLPSFPFADIFVWNLTRMNGYQAEDLSTLKVLQGLDAIPVLLMYGEEDDRVPASAVKEIFDAIPNEKKRVVFFENATHGAAFRSNPELYLDRILNFLGPDDPLNR